MKKMKLLAIGFTILTGIYYASLLICKAMNISFPPALLGLIILTLLLSFKIINVKFIEDICELLLENMALFFIPLFVGVMTYTSLISKNLVPIFATIFISTFLTMILTGFFVQITIKYTDKDNN